MLFRAKHYATRCTSGVNPYAGFRTHCSPSPGDSFRLKTFVCLRWSCVNVTLKNKTKQGASIPCWNVLEGKPTNPMKPASSGNSDTILSFNWEGETVELEFSAFCWVDEASAAWRSDLPPLSCPFPSWEWVGESGLRVRGVVTEEKAEVTEFYSTGEVSHTWG